MATKAQEFRSSQQRAARPTKAKQPRRPRRDLMTDTSLPGVNETDRKHDRASIGNESVRAGAKGGAAFEARPDGRPSRKSTRKSSGRIKRTTNQQLLAIRKATSPSARTTARR